jgi:hypothetical protein
MGPYDSAAFGSSLPKVIDIAQLTKDTEIQERRAIINAEFTAGKLDFELMVVLRSD